MTVHDPVYVVDKEAMLRKARILLKQYGNMKLSHSLSMTKPM